MSQSQQPLTTAAALIEYRRELLTGGFTAEQAFVLARDAASEIVRLEGLGVRSIVEVEA